MSWQTIAPSTRTTAPGGSDSNCTMNSSDASGDQSAGADSPMSASTGAAFFGARLTAPNGNCTCGRMRDISSSSASPTATSGLDGSHDTAVPASWQPRSADSKDTCKRCRFCSNRTDACSSEFAVSGSPLLQLDFDFDSAARRFLFASVTSTVIFRRRCKSSFRRCRSWLWPSPEFTAMSRTSMRTTGFLRKCCSTRLSTASTCAWFASSSPRQFHKKAAGNVSCAPNRFARSPSSSQMTSSGFHPGFTQPPFGSCTATTTRRSPWLRYLSCSFRHRGTASIHGLHHVA